MNSSSFLFLWDSHLLNWNYDLINFYLFILLTFYGMCVCVCGIIQYKVR